MADESVLAQSRKIVDLFRKRQVQRMEALRGGMGTQVVDKLDTVTARDLMREARDWQFAELTGDDEPRGRKYRVMVNMRLASAVDRPVVAARTKRAKRRFLLTKRRGGERALQRLWATATETETTVHSALWLTRSLVVSASREQLEAFASRNDVRSINHDKWMFAGLMDVSRPLIRADQVENNLGFDGSGIDVAVLDTGVDFNHSALSLVMGTQQDFTGEGTGDTIGHGTHCAGTIASNDAVFRGVAPGCTVHDYKILASTLMPVMTMASIAITGIQQAVTDARDVLSNSWGFTHADDYWTCPDGNCVVCTAANGAVDSGVVFVVAAGNEDNDSCATYDTHLRCPGHATLPITVAATDDTDAMAPFSSLGPTADGRAKPDIAAPGVQINSCEAGTTNGFVAFDGTSMATPHVAGVSALMLEKNSALTPQDVKDIIMRTAVNVGHTADEMGAGRVDALDAVNAA
jgi:serine protease AprX